LKSWPDIPTSRELGYADVAALGSLVGVCVHRDTPVDRVKKLHDALKKAVDDPEFHKILEGMGLEAEYMPPETFHRDNLEAEKIAIPLLKELKLFVQ
jgi:tripartite-type tricarboxylate transporter receptor subunit TctC